MVGFARKKSMTDAWSIARYSSAVLILCITFLGPWWLALGLAVLAIIFLKSYESLISGLILDSMYANSTSFSQFGDFIFTSTLLFCISISWLLTPYVRGVDKQ